MRLTKIIKMLRLGILQKTFNFLKRYVQLTYNQRSDVCVITTGPENTLSFQTSLTEGLIPLEEADKIRPAIGNNILTSYGLPKDENEVPVIMLLITPSAVVALGSKAKQFVEDWTGESMVGGLVVVKYCVS